MVLNQTTLIARIVKNELSQEVFRNEDKEYSELWQNITISMKL